MNALLEQFVRDAIGRGVPREEIRGALRTARWRPEEIEAALGAWEDGPSGLAVPRRRLSLSAREAFQHLVLFATLYIFTFDVGVLLFALIERTWPDPAHPAPMWTESAAVLRWPTAGILTALPIYLLVHRLLERSLAGDPEKRTSGVRRWLTYLTLFVAALVLIGDFTAVVTNALGGELTVRFVCKVLVVFVIAGLVFGHFLGALRRDEAEGEARPNRPSWLGRAGIALAALAAVAGVVALGSPQHARQLDLDGRRVHDLQQIDVAVCSYYDKARVLPRTLDDVLRVRGQLESLRDPVTHAAYGYEVEDSVTFRLSADFDANPRVNPNETAIEAEWHWNAGRCSFVRHVLPRAAGALQR